MRLTSTCTGYTHNGLLSLEDSGHPLYSDLRQKLPWVKWIGRRKIQLIKLGVVNWWRRKRYLS